MWAVASFYLTIIVQYDKRIVTFNKIIETTDSGVIVGRKYIIHSVLGYE